jgi:hypothetical protein
MSDKPLTVLFRIPKWMAEEMLQRVEDLTEARHKHPYVGSSSEAFLLALIDGITVGRRTAALCLPEEEQILEDLIQMAIYFRRGHRSSAYPRKVARFRGLEEAARRALRVAKLHPLQRLAIEGLSEFPEKQEFVVMI